MASMPYKPEQLPFEEFNETARRLKRQIDGMAPAYPIVVVATDANGQLLVEQVFTGPHERPVAHVDSDAGDWNVPVTVVAKDDRGMELVETLEKVTVKRLSGSNFVQLEIGADLLGE